MANFTQINESFSSQFSGLNLRDPGTWPWVPKIAACLFLLTLLLTAAWYFYWDGQLDEWNHGQQQELRLKEDYKSKVQQAVNLEELKKQKELVSQYVNALEKQLPSKSQMDALLSDINQAGVGRGLQFELFKPGQVAVKDYYAELPINIKISGQYHDIGAFASDIAHLPRIVTLNNLNINMLKDNTLTLEAIAKTFRYLDADEVATQRKAAKAKQAAGGAK